MRVIIGCVLLALVFAGLFSLTAFSGGIRQAALVWTSALAITALIVVAAFLIAGGAS